MALVQLLIVISILGLVIFFWVLVFKLLIRANEALKIYIEKKQISYPQNEKRDPFEGSLLII